MDASHPDEGPERSGAALFTLLWHTLANLIGTPATATLMRRSLKRALSRRPQLTEVVITRAEHDYDFTLPKRWEEQPDEALEDLRATFEELCMLSQQLTGSVIVRRLEAVAALSRLRRTSTEEKT